MTLEEVEQNKYTPKPANMEKWFAATGGINGEPKGLELDALPPDRIREIFVTSIKKYINQAVYEKIIKSSYIRKVALEAIKPKLERILSGIVDEVEGQINIYEFNVTDLAIDGHRSLPVGKLCYGGNMDEVIKDRVLAHFK